MKKLFIIRHGKSSWEYLVDDIDRPLIERGIKGAHTIAERLVEAGHIPEKVLSSPAARALHTAEIVTRICGIDTTTLVVCDDLYLAEAKDILKIIEKTDPNVNALAIFGHNPGFTDIANRFLNPGIDNLPTAGVLVLSFNTDSWAQLERKNVSDIYFDYPKKQI